MLRKEAGDSYLHDENRIYIYVCRIWFVPCLQFAYAFGFLENIIHHHMIEKFNCSFFLVYLYLVEKREAGRGRDGLCSIMRESKE
jgi:hypothetical protein